MGNYNKLTSFEFSWHWFFRLWSSWLWLCVSYRWLSSLCRNIMHPFWTLSTMSVSAYKIAWRHNSTMVWKMVGHLCWPPKLLQVRLLPDLPQDASHFLSVSRFQIGSLSAELKICFAIHIFSLLIFIIIVLYRIVAFCTCNQPPL
jgi:hypothetical protein